MSSNNKELYKPGLKVHTLIRKAPDGLKFRIQDNRYTPEIYEIENVYTQEFAVPMYKIKGIGETLFYKYELLPATENELADDKLILEEGDGKVFYVEKLIDKKIINDLVHFLVKWKNCPSSQNTWEPRYRLIKTPLLKRMIDRYDGNI